MRSSTNHTNKSRLWNFGLPRFLGLDKNMKAPRPIQNSRVIGFPSKDKTRKRGILELWGSGVPICPKQKTKESKKERKQKERKGGPAFSCQRK